MFPIVFSPHSTLFLPRSDVGDESRLADTYITIQISSVLPVIKNKSRSGPTPRDWKLSAEFYWSSEHGPFLLVPRKSVGSTITPSTPLWRAMTKGPTSRTRDRTKLCCCEKLPLSANPELLPWGVGYIRQSQPNPFWTCTTGTHASRTSVIRERWREPVFRTGQSWIRRRKLMESDDAASCYKMEQWNST